MSRGPCLVTGSVPGISCHERETGTDYSIWDKYKDVYARNRTKELRLVE